jgi:hypothetical protein
MESIISLSDASDILDPERVAKLVHCSARAQQAWFGDYNHVVLDDPSIRGFLIYKHFHHEAHIALANARGVRFGEHEGQKFISFDDRLFVRHKHFDKRLSASNYQTRHARRWVRQESLPLIEGIARLNFGYRLDDTGEVMKDRFITLPNGRRDLINENDWVWQLLGNPIDSSTWGVQARFNSAGRNLPAVYRYDDYSASA